MKLHKLLSILFVLSIVSFSAWCLPGVKAYLPDSSGEYVYYQDTSFARPTFVGFLYYNESQYALRYYAAADAKTKQDEVDIEIAFSVNPESEKLDVTGELVIKDGDSTLINYLHDLFYDFIERRQKAGNVSGTADVNKNDFLDYFGGSVVIKYNALVPIFNVKAVQSDSGEEKLKLVTVGALKSSSDTSFDDFKGFPKKLADIKRKAPKSNKNKITAQVETASTKMSAELDGSWEQSMANVWLQGDAASLTLASMVKSNEDDALIRAFLLRNMLRSSENAYIDISSAAITADSESFSVTAQYYLGADKGVKHDTQRFTKTVNGYAYVRLTVFDSLYQKKKSYYENILKSFTAE